MKLLRVLYFPLYYHKLMERMNLMHYGVNRFTNEVVMSAQDCYPLLRSYHFEIDPREDRIYELHRMEKKLDHVFY